MDEKIRVIQWATGACGRDVVSLITQKRNIEVTGAIVHDASKVGRDLGDIIGEKKKNFRKKLGIIASDNEDEVLKTKADVVVINTPASPVDNAEQISKALKAKKNVITTVGFMYPWKTYPEISQEIDRLAKENGVSFLGTGAYPGFLSYLPSILTGGLARIDQISMEYCDDLTHWDSITMVRDKMRIGTNPVEFDKSEDRPHWIAQIYAEVVHFIADYLGLELTDLRQTWERYVAKEHLQTVCMEIEPGNVCAFKVTNEGMRGNDVLISIIYDCVVCPDRVKKPREPGCSIWLDGRPPMEIDVNIDYGRWAMLLTAAAVVNAIPLVVQAPPGLITLKDLPPVIAVQ
ncbi:MAG: hypothetical protein SV686_09140 [Thermodesulfobacteriota bacterium]|nr:hypothetical protein [Thermodesulfobacteriota bacterium]